jgi:hypothetical protein
VNFLRDTHHQHFESELDNIISRQGQLPTLMVFSTGE